MPENEVVASFLYLQKLWNTRLYMNLRMTEKVCCFENVCHVWLWNFPSESAMVQQLLPFKLLHKRTTKRKQRIFTTSMEFWPKVATKSSTERRFVRFNLDGAIWGGRFFWGRMAMYLNEMTSRMNNWFGVIRTSKFWMINFLKFATLIPWSLPRIVFFFLKKIWKIDLGFPYLGLYATACVQVFRVHCNTKSFAALFSWHVLFDKLLWKERSTRGSVTDLQETPKIFPARFSGNPGSFAVWHFLTCSMRFGWKFQLWMWWKWWKGQLKISNGRSNSYTIFSIFFQQSWKRKITHLKKMNAFSFIFHFHHFSNSMVMGERVYRALLQCPYIGFLKCAGEGRAQEALGNTLQTYPNNK